MSLSSWRETGRSRGRFSSQQNIQGLMPNHASSHKVITRYPKLCGFACANRVRGKPVQHHFDIREGMRPSHIQTLCARYTSDDRIEFESRRILMRSYVRFKWWEGGKPSKLQRNSVLPPHFVPTRTGVGVGHVTQAVRCADPMYAFTLSTPRDDEKGENAK